jgi:Leucine-rich repeat (LRR) protein
VTINILVILISAVFLGILWKLLHRYRSLSIANSWRIDDQHAYKEAKRRIAALNETSTYLDLSDLKGLKSLPLEVSKLAGLMELDLQGTRVSDISCLATLNQLQDINLQETLVANIAMLRRAENKIYIRLKGSPADVLERAEFEARMTQEKQLAKQRYEILENWKTDSQAAYREAEQRIRNCPDDASSINFIDLDALEVIPKEIWRLNKLTSIRLSNTKITNLTSIAHCADLQELYLDNTPFNQVAQLNPLTELQTLDLSKTPIEHITSLVGLSNLTTLSLSGTQFKAITQLVRFTKLTSLDLSETHVVDISPLAQMTSIKELYLEKTDIEDIAALASLVNLFRLSIRETKVTSLAAIASLGKLHILNLSNTLVEDVSVLDGLMPVGPNDTHLNYADTPAYKNGKLEEYRRLRRILWESDATAALIEATRRVKIRGGVTHKLDYSDLKALEQIPQEVGDMTAISGLILDHTKITNLDVLIKLKDLTTSIREISFIHTKIKDLTPLEGFATLNEINCSGSQVQSLEPLANLVELRTFTAVGTLIHNIEPLSKHINLRNIDLSYCPVEDISALSNLTQLERLRIDNTLVAKLFPLKNLTKLQYLSVYETSVINFSEITNLLAFGLRAYGASSVKREDVNVIRSVFQKNH